jgi:hypothetical protein
MRTNTTVRAGAASALLLVLAGCGGGGSTPSAASSAPPSTSVSTAASPSPSASSGTGAQSGGLSKAGLIAAMKRAVAQQKSAHMDMQMSTAQGVISARGDVSYSPATAMRMTMQIPGVSSGTVQMRIVDGVIYMAMPPMTPKGKWLKIDPKDASGPLAGQFKGLQDQLDPRRSFDAFGSGLKKVEYVGSESVDGEDMDHYVLTVDSSSTLKKLGQQAPAGIPRTTTYDLWLDKHQLVRRMQMQLAGISMDTRLSDWGKPVHVTAPPRGAQLMMPSTAG